MDHQFGYGQRARMKGEYQSRFPSTRHAASAARRELVSYIEGWGFGGEELSDIETAIGEALANAAEHGHRVNSTFDVRAYVQAEALVVEIEDDGSGFTHDRARHGGAPEGDAPRGFGIFIMQQLMDSIEYNERGTRVRLTKRLPSGAGANGEITEAG